LFSTTKNSHRDEEHLMHTSYSLMLMVREQQDQIARRAATAPARRKAVKPGHRGFRRRTAP